MRAWTVSIAVAVSSASCARTWTDFSPYSATSVKRPFTSEAVFAFPGDVATLREAGGELVGGIAVNGNGYASRDDVRERALREAAALGGTHVFIAGEEANTNWARVTNDRAVTNFSGNSATTTYQPGLVVPVTTHSGTFVVVRVPPEHWVHLPAQLRPAPNAYASKRMRSEAKTASQPAPATSDPFKGEAANWYCQSGGDTSDRCFRTEDKCVAADTQVACDEEEYAYCFSARLGGVDEEDNDPLLRCYATREACRVVRDASFTSGFQIVNECTKSE